MVKQEYKIECDGTCFYFYQHSLMSAWEHASVFIDRNKDKYDMKLFRLNPNNYGNKWLLQSIESRV